MGGRKPSCSPMSRVGGEGGQGDGQREVEPREGERDFSGLHSTASLLDSTTSPMANKRKRQDNSTNPTNEPGMDNDEAAEEAQQDREEEQQPQEAILPDGTVVKLPQVRSYPHLTTLKIRTLTRRCCVTPETLLPSTSSRQPARRPRARIVSLSAFALLLQPSLLGSTCIRADL
jgi:hypothetical protein